MTTGRLTAAFAAAEARKAAALGVENEDDERSINFSTEEQSRRIISGFDIDFDELRPIAFRAGRFFAEMGLDINLTHSHEAAWTEGLLVGLFAATVPPADE